MATAADSHGGASGEGHSLAELIAEAMVTTPTGMGDYLAVAPVAICIFAATICMMLRRWPDWHPWIAGTAFGLLVLCNAGLLARVMADGMLVMTMGGWLPPFGITFAVDPFGALLALIASVIGLFATIYATRDVETVARRFGFYPLLLFLVCGVSGAFLTGDIFNLYVWFEVLLIASFGLLVLGGERAQLDGAVKYAFLNLIATTLFLISVGYLYGLFGTLNMADIARITHDAEAVGAAPLVTLSVLFAFAFAMKAAAFPLNSWLPASYHTPRIVVAAVFAGLLTKVGVYALYRTLVMLLPPGIVELDGPFLVLAVGTMLVGAIGALAQADLRRMLGYLVISGIGSMLVGLGLHTAEGLAGGIVYAVHSILVMTALYLIVGVVERLGGTARLSGLGGLYAASPITAVLFLVLGFAVAGLPPFSGFLPKVMIVQAALAQGQGIVVAALLFASLLSVIAVGRAWAHAFWRGGPVGTPDGAEGPPLMRLEGDLRPLLLGPVAALSVLVVALGIFGAPIVEIAQTAARDLLQPTTYRIEVLGEGFDPAGHDAHAIDSGHENAADHGSDADHGGEADGHGAAASQTGPMPDDGEGAQ